MVVFPQPLELSKGSRELSPQNAPFFPRENPQLATTGTHVLHKSTDPYYNYYSSK